MKAVASLLAALLLQTVPTNEPPVAHPATMRYERAITTPAATGQACAVLDAQIFPHASPALVDLRVFPTQGGAAPVAAH